MNKPTPTQMRYLSFIQTYTIGFGMAPAEVEIAAALQVSPPSVNQMVKTLESKGFIRRQPGLARSIEVMFPADSIPHWPKRIVASQLKWVLDEPAERPAAPVRVAKKFVAKKSVANKAVAKGTTRRPKKVDRVQAIETALRKQTKSDIIELILKLAKGDDSLTRELELELNVDKPPKQLVSDVRSAIDRATDFDARMVNHNFDYDMMAYEEVEQGLKRLIELERLEDAKSLSLQLMTDGSYQVVCSDEGIMSEEIADCLKPVIRAVKAAGGQEAAKWAKSMLLADRAGFICQRELNQLAGRS